MDSDGLPTSGGSLNRRIARGAAWMVGLHFVDRCIGLGCTIVLARLLVPADFGLVMLATAMVAAVTVFGEFGFEMALIQNQKAERRHYDTVWTLGMLRGLVAAAVIAIAAEPLAAFFADPRLEAVILAFALMPILEGLYNIGTVAFRKDLTLNKEFVFRMVPRVAGAGVTVVLAFAWRDYWALVIGTLGGRAVRVVMSYIMHSFRPRLTLGAWREIMSFSKWMLVTGLATFAHRKLGIFLIAKLLDAGAVGLFSTASQISNMASAEVIAPIKQVLFPGYAKIAHDIKLLRKAFIDAYGILVLVALPTAVGIGLTADYFVPLLLGPNWIGTIPLIEILVISGGLRSLSSHGRPVYLAMNRPKIGAYASVMTTIAYLPMLYFGLKAYGIVGAAAASAVINVAIFLGSMYLMKRYLALRPRDIFSATWRALAACLLMTLTVVALKWSFPVAESGFGDLLAHLLSAIGIGASVYIGIVLLLWWLCGKPNDSAEYHTLSYISGMLRVRSRSINRPASGEHSGTAG